MKEGALDRFLAEIRRHPLLTREEEVTLARRVRAGDPEALDRLVRSNLRLVVAVARRHARGAQSLEELVNEGNVGLMRAARRFDPSRDVRFATYAVWWIRQAVLAALSCESRLVRLPANRLAAARRVSRATRAIRQRSGGQGDAREVAAELGISEAAVREAFAYGARDVSLDAPLGEGAGSMLDVISDTAEAGPDQRLEREAMRTALRGCLDRLPADEAAVIRSYYGLAGSESASLSEIGAQLGMSRETATAVRDRALSRLRLAEDGELTSFARD